MNWNIIVTSLPGPGCEYRLLHELRAMGKFHTTEFKDVRLERRGLIGQVISPEVERSVADHLFALAEKEGREVMASFKDADYIVAAETLGHECGVMLLTRDLRQRYSFVKTG